MLEHAGQRAHRTGGVEAVGHEQRGDQVVDGQTRSRPPAGGGPASAAGGAGGGPGSRAWSRGRARPPSLRHRSSGRAPGARRSDRAPATAQAGGPPRPATTASTRPSSVWARASGDVQPGRPDRAPDVTGPIDATTRGTPSAPSRSTVRSTVDDEVKATASAARARVHGARVRRPGHRAVRHHLVHPPALGRRARAPTTSRTRSARTNRTRRSPAGAGRPAAAAAVGNTATRASDTAPFGHQVGDDAPVHQRLGRRRPDGGPPGRRGHPSAVQGVHDPGDGVGRGDHHPLVGPAEHPVGGGGQRRPPSAGSSMAMTGSSTTTAPRPVSRSTRTEAWARARVTTTVRPANGRGAAGPGAGGAGAGEAPGIVAAHRLTPPPRRSRPPVTSSPATAPTTMVAGAGRSTSARWARSVRTTCWRSVVPQWTTATGVVAVTAGGQEPLGDGRPRAHAHEHDERAVEAAQHVPVHSGHRRVPGVSGDDGHRRRHRSVRDGDPGGGRRRERRADPGHHLHLDPGPTQGLGLLAPAAEHERVASLQAYDPDPTAPVGDQQLVDAGLPVGLARTLAHVDALGRRGGQIEEFRGDEPVVDHHLGGGQEFGPPSGEQAGIAGAGAHEGDAHAEGRHGPRSPPPASSNR